MGRERDTIKATLRELNYLLGLRNHLSRETQELLEDPLSPAHQEMEEMVAENVTQRLDHQRDITHRAGPLGFEGNLTQAAREAALRCEACLGVGVSPNEGGLCRVCEGTGIDLSKRPASQFLSWSQKKEEPPLPPPETEPEI